MTPVLNTLWYTTDTKYLGYVDISPKEIPFSDQFMAIFHKIRKNAKSTIKNAFFVWEVTKLIFLYSYIDMPLIIRETKNPNLTARLRDFSYFFSKNGSFEQKNAFSSIFVIKKLQKSHFQDHFLIFWQNWLKNHATSRIEIQNFYCVLISRERRQTYLKTSSAIFFWKLGHASIEGW